jgi:hypothetical protein
VKVSILTITLKHIYRKVRLQVFEIQGNRASAYVNKESEFEEPPGYEKDILRKLGPIILFGSFFNIRSVLVTLGAIMI